MAPERSTFKIFLVNRHVMECREVVFVSASVSRKEKKRVPGGWDFYILKRIFSVSCQTFRNFENISYAYFLQSSHCRLFNPVQKNSIFVYAFPLWKKVPNSNLGVSWHVFQNTGNLLKIKSNSIWIKPMIRFRVILDTRAGDNWYSAPAWWVLSLCFVIDNCVSLYIVFVSNDSRVVFLMSYYILTIMFIFLLTS